MTEHTFNAASETDIRDAEERRKDERAQEINDVRDLLSTPAGKRYFNRLLAECGIYHTSFTGDNNATNYREGKRAIGLYVLMDLEDADPAAMVKLIQMRKNNG